MNIFKDSAFVFLKGAAMGAANVIPGVSGGTIAFITGIYERLINSLKSFDLTAIRMLLRFDLRGFVQHTDSVFLATLLSGVLLSILTLAKILEYLFVKEPVYIWAFFFGLILASIFFVGRMVKRWGTGSLIALVIGVVIAVTISVLTPGTENRSFAYLIVCGVVAVCSMIVPGISGSFVLLLMGNYMLVIGAISRVTSALKSLQITDEAVEAIRILVPVGIGCVFGLVAFSHLLAWIFRRFHDFAVALMTGFVAGSLLIIWPWKRVVHLVDAQGELVIRKGEKVISGYEWLLPPLDGTTLVAAGVMFVGVVVVWVIEKMGVQQPK